MKRFSSKRSLSNCQTGVRETVNLIFKHFLAIVLLILFAGTNQLSEARDGDREGKSLSSGGSYRGINYCAGPDKDEELCKDQRDQSRLAAKQAQLALDQAESAKDSHRVRICEGLQKDINEIGKKASEACSSANLGGNNFPRCFTEITWCNEGENEIGALAEEDEVSDEEFCDAAFANKCSGLPRYSESRNYREEEKDAERDRVESKRELDSLNKERKEAQRDLLKQQRELQEAQQDAAYEVRKMEREIAKDMADQFKEVQEGQKRAFEDAQKTYQEMDAAYIKMRQESRNMALKVEQAKDEFHGKCIAQAESQFKAAEAARLAAKKNASKKNSGTATRLAGTSRRNAANATRTRNFDYSAYLNECLNAQTGVGKSLSNSVRAAEREKAANDQFLAEQAALIEQQRQTMLKKLGELEGVTNAQNEEIVKSTNERTQQLYEEQQRVAQKNQMRLQEFQQEQQLLLTDIDARIQTENQEFMKYQSKSMVAQRRLACAGSAARMSERSSERRGNGFNEAVPLIDSVHDTCMRFGGICSPTAASASSDGAISLDRMMASTTPSGGAAPSAVTYTWPQACILARDSKDPKKTKKYNRPAYSPYKSER